MKMRDEFTRTISRFTGIYTCIYMVLADFENSGFSGYYFEITCSIYKKMRDEFTRNISRYNF